MKPGVRIFAAALLLLAADRAHSAHPALPVIPAAVFDVTHFGAAGDGAKDNTAAIQGAIDAAAAAGGGTVDFPAGDYLSGPLTLRSRLNLRVEAGAVLRMLPFGTYPGGVKDARTFITCNDVHDLEISGAGAIDGQGAAWWAAFLHDPKGGLVRPMMLNLFSVNRLFIHDITFQNPPFHHCGLRGNGGNITISNLTVSTPSPSPNTDGLNFVGTNSVIEDCHISVGDDNIAMGSSGPINDLLITNCYFGTGHGVSIGSGISAGITNLTVADCAFNGTQSGIRLKCAGRSAPVRGLNYFNLTMTNVNLPIVLYSYYDQTGTPRKVTTEQVLAPRNRHPVTAMTPDWRDITFSNLTVFSPHADIAGVVWGPAELPIANLTLVHVTNNVPKTFDLYNVRGVKIIDCQFNFPGGNTFTLCNADVTITNTLPAGRPVGLGGVPAGSSLALGNAVVAQDGDSAFAANPLTLEGSVLKKAGDLDLGAATAQNFFLGTNGSSVAVAGNLTLNGTINIGRAGGFGATRYTLFTYTGKLAGQPVLGTTPVGYGCKLDTNTPGQVRLTVSALTTARLDKP